MQSNYFELLNAMSVADTKAVATQRQATSGLLLMYRGATYAQSKRSNASSSRVEVRLLPAYAQLHYRGASYQTGSVVTATAQSRRVVNQLIYSDATYQLSSFD